MSEEHGSVNSEENSDDEPTRRMVSWNEYEGRWLGIRVGGGFLYDVVHQGADAKATASWTASENHRGHPVLPVPHSAPDLIPAGFAVIQAHCAVERRCKRGRSSVG